MISGNLKFKADLYNRSGDSNNIDYTYFKTINAQILYKSGAAVVQSYQSLDTKSITIRIRNRKDIETTMRVKIKDEWFDIIHIQQVGGFNGDLLIDLTLTV